MNRVHPLTDPSPITVLQVITHLEMGGAEAVALSLAERMPDARSMMFAVQHAAGPFSRALTERLAKASIPCCTGSRLPFKRGGLLAAALTLVRHIREEKPDIVHLHTEIPEAVWAVASRFSRRVRDTPVVRTIHNTQLWPKWGGIGRWAEHQFSDQHVVGVSSRSLEAWRAFRATAVAMPVARERTSVILNGVARPQATSPAGGTTRLPQVLVAGRLEPQKGVDLLPAIWAMTTARCRIQPELTIIGTGSLEPMVRTAFDSDSGVSILAPMPELAATFDRYDVLLMPSRFEGLALMAVEAMMAGLPVVAANVPGLREIFPEDYPFLAPCEDVAAFADRLCEAIDDRARTRSLVAFDHVRRHFDLDRVVAAYRKLYDNVAAG